MTSNISAQFTIGTDNAGNLLVEVPCANGARRKIQFQPGGLESAIRDELERRGAVLRHETLHTAAKRATENAARHNRIVEYISEKHPTLLSRVEPGAKPSKRMQDAIKHSGKFSVAELAAMQRNGELNFSAALKRQHNTANPAPRAPLPLSSENLPI